MRLHPANLLRLKLRTPVSAPNTASMARDELDGPLHEIFGLAQLRGTTPRPYPSGLAAWARRALRSVLPAPARGVRLGLNSPPDCSERPCSPSAIIRDPSSSIRASVVKAGQKKGAPEGAPLGRCRVVAGIRSDRRPTSTGCRDDPSDRRRSPAGSSGTARRSPARHGSRHRPRRTGSR